MPKRTEQHRIADRGIQNVKLAFAEAGWACDEVGAGSDYGEDLIAQTSLNEVVDPHRIFVQVKSAKKTPAKRDEKFCYMVRREHLKKWLRNPDHFIFVLWIEELSEGFYVYPSRDYSTWDLDHGGSKNIQLNIPVENKLDSDNLRAIEWQARINNWHRHLLELHSYIDSLAPNDFCSIACHANEWKKGTRDATGICLEFLSAIDLVCLQPEGAHITQRFFHIWFEILKLKNSISDEKESLEIRMSQATILFILWRMRDIAHGVGIPPKLLEVSTRLLAIIALGSLEESDYNELDIDPDPVVL